MTRLADTFPRLGGAPLLDALNTIGGPRGDRAEHELIGTPADLAAWAASADLFDPESLDALQRRLDQDGAPILARFRMFRAAAFSVLDAARTGAPPPNQALQALAQTIAAAKARARLDLVEGQVVWMPGRDAAGELVTDQLALEADAFLAGPDLQRLRRCKRCSWLFLAPRRGRPRVWCSMELCGNRDKQARHQARLRAR
jgi:predicted RNA-binding Zn ribbon-like protein